MPNADFASRLVEETPFPQTPSATSRLVEETPFPQTPSAMEEQIKFMEVFISNRQKEKDRSPTHSGRRQKKKN